MKQTIEIDDYDVANVTIYDVKDVVNLHVIPASPASTKFAVVELRPKTPPQPPAKFKKGEGIEHKGKYRRIVDMDYHSGEWWYSLTYNVGNIPEFLIRSWQPRISTKDEPSWVKVVGAHIKGKITQIYLNANGSVWASIDVGYGHLGFYSLSDLEPHTPEEKAK